MTAIEAKTCMNTGRRCTYQGIPCFIAAYDAGFPEHARIWSIVGHTLPARIDEISIEGIK